MIIALVNYPGSNFSLMELNFFGEKTNDELEQLKGEIDTDNEIPGPVAGDEILRQNLPDEVTKIFILTYISCSSGVFY